jgi:hypothetical protein
LSVLNQASDGLYTVLIALVRANVGFGPRSREDLLLSCGSAVDLVDGSQLTRTLNRWTELGLFSQEAGSVTIAEPYCSELGKSADEAEKRLPRIVRTVAMLAENNERFWEQEKSRSADLSRAVAWMLAQDVYTLDANVKKLAILEEGQIIDSAKQTIGKNDTRWNGLKAWMLYLGFARGGMQWVVDPTQALRESLADIFGSNRELTGPAFVERAASVLPVLDRGTYRTQVEESLKERAWPKPPTGLLSSSLSRAIQRLGREGAITLSNRSDTGGVVTLAGTNMRPWREVSHIALPPARKAR